MISWDELVDGFRRVFESAPEAMARAPGRVNLIGEHIDYAGGYVLPVAIARGVGVAARRNSENGFRLYPSDISQSVIAVNLNAAKPEGCAAFVWVLTKKLNASPADIFVRGDLPIGMGLASSAAYCVALAMALVELNPDVAMPGKTELAALCAEAEREATGVACGLMDLYAALFGRRGFALLLDCDKRTHREVPLNLGDACLLVVDSAVPRLLAESGYNERRREVDEIMAALRKCPGAFESIRDFDGGRLENAEAALSPELRKRLRHLLTEEKRVLDFVSALEIGDVPALGELLLASHKSLRDDFAVSCGELDFLVEELANLLGVYGARLVGGGFGGGVLALVLRSVAEEVSRQIRESYFERFGLVARTEVVESGDGAEVQRGIPLV